MLKFIVYGDIFVALEDGKVISINHMEKDNWIGICGDMTSLIFGKRVMCCRNMGDEKEVAEFVEFVEENWSDVGESENYMDMPNWYSHELDRSESYYAKIRDEITFVLQG